MILLEIILQSMIVTIPLWIIVFNQRQNRRYGILIIAHNLWTCYPVLMEWPKPLKYA